jgi:hypothetical protein
MYTIQLQQQQEALIPVLTSQSQYVHVVLMALPDCGKG